MENNSKGIIKELLDKDKCHGCSACMNICPVDAISMKFDNEGFFYPQINDEECIKCKKCVIMCPTNKGKKARIVNPKKIFTSHANDLNIVESASSGGLFPLLSQYVIEKKGVVFGAVYNNLDKNIIHSSSDNIQLNKIYRSKYVQSKIGNSFKLIKENLEKDRLVLFSGTPCQVEGLKAYLKRDYSSLITIDFMCHGVPSPIVFKDRLKFYEKKENSRIIDCTFREKDNGWKNQVIKLYFENKKVLKFSSKFSAYYNMFTNNYILRKSCYNCNLYNRHQSDITLADAWSSNINEKGVSRVFINTEKGDSIINNISSNLKKFIQESEDLEKYKHGFSHKNRDWFYNKFNINEDNNKLYKKAKVRCLVYRLKNKIIR